MAGGVAATAQYAIVRDTLAPTGRTTLLADSGPLFNAPLTGTSDQYPSLPLHSKIRSTWGLDSPQGIIAALAAKLPGLDLTNMGSLNPALAQKYPNDRFGYILFEDDQIFSGFSYYDFYPYIQQEKDPKVQGEGDYEAARRHRKRVSEFIENNDVEKAAVRAAPDSRAEADQLNAAEEAGKARAKGEDPGHVRVARRELPCPFSTFSTPVGSATPSYPLKVA